MHLPGKLRGLKRRLLRRREGQYLDIRLRVLIEPILDDGHEDGPLDYRFWCFDGRPKLVQVDNRYHSINPFYDLDWSNISLRYRMEAQERDVSKPENMAGMIDVASALSSNFDFVRKAKSTPTTWLRGMYLGCCFGQQNHAFVGR
jgi:hypothetical protein